MEEWLVFWHNGKEIGAYTIRGTFAGERAATIELFAEGYNIPEKEIYTTIERR